jgi:predicted nucleic-acid-binding protein
VWVLSRAYKTPRAAIAAAFETLLRARELVVENTEATYLALGVYHSTNVDFADALIARGGRLADCSETVTFDRAVAAGVGMRLLNA